MKTIIFQNNGHSKVIHGRFGGCEESRHFHCCDRPSRPQIAQKILANEARLEIAECKGNPQVFDADLPHPHDLGLPSLSLVVTSVVGLRKFFMVPLVLRNLATLVSSSKCPLAVVMVVAAVVAAEVADG